ncbi:MAG: hypothetical protein COU81_02100 [Candidatus Portnoybacteria bacterium CG10_big_fil_rev_8_21_14_0_10_36_7]|uniref:Uncharacterized protein n=1 Tax=Candidatus Portnoybacteria bacterium CG10_big_fil_rev_8_21_14_0_10_36_7 TaxID=1974812 RepID=A0A2M8KE27_9BACT|nr:MAG: hypothetical protein COU81_02100 [Candidatus Portnoybacteria bacterium CG10_big_fil_rev_8_21_14_0_10_36_7]
MNLNKVTLQDVSGIKTVFLGEAAVPKGLLSKEGSDNCFGQLVRIIPRYYVRDNAYFRKVEDRKNGIWVKSNEIYREEAITMFSGLGLTIVDDDFYKSFRYQAPCDHCGDIIFLTEEQRNVAIWQGKVVRLEEHTHTSNLAHAMMR